MQLDFLQKNCHASHWNHYAWKCIMLKMGNYIAISFDSF